MVMLTILTLLGLSLFVGQLNSTQYRSQLTRNTASALSEAKEALVGDAVSRVSIDEAVYLRLPDLGYNYPGATPREGIASGNFAGNAKDYTVIGKLPWKTLDTVVPREGMNCLWYVISGRFKIEPETDALNWDTLGQIDIIDGAGAVIATNVAALLVAPGAPLAGQDRSLANAAYTECGGNYDARNYLDTHSVDDAVSGEVNYFSGSTNNRVALDKNNKRFVATASEHYNDQFLAISADDLFNPLIKRDDFSTAIGNLLANASFGSIAITGDKGTDSLNCGADVFCKNWKEMFLLKQLQTPGQISIDGTPSGTCSRIVFFSGRKGAGQSRSTATEKSDVSNYLEGTNASSFNVADAPASDFSGASTFNWQTPEMDLVRCLP